MADPHDPPEDDPVALAALAAAGDPRAAPGLRRLAARLLALADGLESGGAVRDPGGVADRVRVNLVGPDGAVKQSVDVTG